VTAGNNSGGKGDLEDTTSVIKLDLSDNNLSGTIPKEIGDMTALQTLNLDNSHLNGSIPVEINNLNSLQTLELSNNKLSDLPPLTLTTLDTLLINNNEFSFEDILPNLNVPNVGINYLVQDSIGVRKDTLSRVGLSIKFFTSDSANHNIYQRPTNLRVSMRTGIDDINIPGIKIYPNPTGGILYIEIDKSLSVKSKIIVTDIFGKAVINKAFEDVTKQELNLTHLSKGMYFLQIQNKNNRYFQKVVIR
jgi:Leucine-rich repeat (LRR) protein